MLPWILSSWLQTTTQMYRKYRRMEIAQWAGVISGLEGSLTSAGWRSSCDKSQHSARGGGQRGWPSYIQWRMKVRANPQRDVRGITVNVWLVFLLLLCLSGVFSGLTLSTTTTKHYPYLSIVNALHLYSAFLVLLTTWGALKSQSNSLFNFKIDKEDFCKAEKCTTTNRKYPSLSAQPWRAWGNLHRADKSGALSVLMDNWVFNVAVQRIHLWCILDLWDTPVTSL